jgi:hypothetical protein
LIIPIKTNQSAVRASTKVSRDFDVIRTVSCTDDFLVKTRTKCLKFSRAQLEPLSAIKFWKLKNPRKQILAVDVADGNGGPSVSVRSRIRLFGPGRLSDFFVSQSDAAAHRSSAIANRDPWL